MDDVIAGACVFTLERSAAGYRLNKMARTLVSPAARADFQADEAGYMTRHGCSGAEVDLVRRRDWHGLIQAVGRATGGGH